MEPDSHHVLHVAIPLPAISQILQIGVKSDVWSLGCILYNLVYGRTPFQHISSPLEKLSAISNPDTKISFPEIENKNLMDVMQLCLQFQPHKRPSIEELLRHPYLTVEPKKNNPVTPSQEELHLKQMMDQLAKLTPTRLEKVTSVSI